MDAREHREVRRRSEEGVRLGDECGRLSHDDGRHGAAVPEGARTRHPELAGLAPVSGQATKHFNVRKFSGDTDPQYLPKIDTLAPLAYCSKDIPPIISICGEEPWEWKCRSEENRLLISSCVALGHDKAWFVSCPFADHGRAFTAGVPYVEMFVKGRIPPTLKAK